MWDPEDPFVYLWGKVEKETKNKLISGLTIVFILQ